LRFLPLLCLCLAAPGFAADPVTITGQVLLPDGTPAAGARVGAGGAGTVPTWDETTSGPDGSFRLAVAAGPESRSRSVIALKPGYALGWTQVTGTPPGPITVRLGDNPATYRGRVCDPDGNPLAGATVKVAALIRSDQNYSNSPYLRGSGAIVATTDPEGRYSFPDLPAGYQLSLVVTGPRRAEVSQVVHVGGATLPTILAPEATISGRVLREGQPVASIKVSISTGSELVQAVTDNQGAYRLNGLGITRGALEIVEPPAGWVAAPVMLPVLKPGDEVKGLDLTLTPGALVRGKVTDAATGRPSADVAGFLVWSDVKTPARSSYEVKIGPDGAYEVRVPAGHVQVSVYAQGGLYWGGQGDQNRPQFDLKEGETREGVDFVVTPPTLLKGHLQGPDGTPASGLEVRVASMPSFVASAYRIKTDATGAWSLPFPMGNPWGGGGAQLILAQDPATGLVAEAWVDKAPDEVILILSPGAYVTCQATDPQGRPLKDVLVAAQVSPGQPDPPREQPVRGYAALPPVATDALGQARLGPLPAGDDVFLLLQSDQFYQVSRGWPGARFTLAAGEEHAVPTLVIDREGKTVAGTVLDLRGRPAVGALVYAALAPEAVETDANGHFTLPHVPPSLPRMKPMAPVKPGDPQPPPPPMAILYAMDPIHPLVGTVEIAADQAGNAQLRLTALGSATGQIVDEAGKPQPGVQVQFYSDSQAPQEIMSRLQALGGGNRQTSTDAQGKWQAEGLIPGLAYRVNFWGPDGNTGGGTPQDVTCTPGQTVDLGQTVLKPVQRVAPELPTGPAPTPPPTVTGAGGPPPPK
jgi:hypothetical protein